MAIQGLDTFCLFLQEEDSFYKANLNIGYHLDFGRLVEISLIYCFCVRFLAAKHFGSFPDGTIPSVSVKANTLLIMKFCWNFAISYFYKVVI